MEWKDAKSLKFKGQLPSCKLGTVFPRFNFILQYPQNILPFGISTQLHQLLDPLPSVARWRSRALLAGRCTECNCWRSAIPQHEGVSRLLPISESCFNMASLCRLSRLVHRPWRTLQGWFIEPLGRRYLGPTCPWKKGKGNFSLRELGIF